MNGNNKKRGKKIKCITYTSSNHSNGKNVCWPTGKSPLSPNKRNVKCICAFGMLEVATRIELVGQVPHSWSSPRDSPLNSGRKSSAYSK